MVAVQDALSAALAARGLNVSALASISIRSDNIAQVQMRSGLELTAATVASLVTAGLGLTIAGQPVPTTLGFFF